MYNKLVDQLKTHCIAEYPREACGLITLDYEYIPCKNLSETPLKSFILDPFMLVKYDRNIWGLFHSHPGDESPYPSRDDKHDPILSCYKFIVGNANELFIYSYDGEFNIEPFEERHVS